MFKYIKASIMLNFFYSTGYWTEQSLHLPGNWTCEIVCLRVSAIFRQFLVACKQSLQAVNWTEPDCVWSASLRTTGAPPNDSFANFRSRRSPQQTVCTDYFRSWSWRFYTCRSRSINVGRRRAAEAGIAVCRLIAAPRSFSNVLIPSNASRATLQ